MKADDNQNSNPFMKQIGKLFEDLAAKQQEKPVSPRITCTRLRRLREIRRELVLDSDIDGNQGNELESECLDPSSIIKKRNESFADWVLHNQQVHQQFIDKQNQFREQVYSNRDNKEMNKTVHGFANFSPSALQVVAKNPNTPISTLKWLAAHYRLEVRQAVAINENLDPDILCVLARDGEDSVRGAILNHAKLPHDLLLRLCDDHSPLVSEKAKNILYEKTKSELRNNQIPQSMENVNVSAQNMPVETRNKTEKINDQESKRIEREFLAVIAEKSTTPPRRLAELATHHDSTIRSLVAINPNSTPEIFWRLAKDPLPEVRSKLINNYNCPKEIIDYVKKII